MIECRITEKFGITWLMVNGRIDSMTSNEIQASIDALIDRGVLTMAADLEGVNYVSSAGLRVFISAQKRLKKAGGEIILCRPPENVLKIFKMSGFDSILRIISTDMELESSLSALKPAGASASKTINDIKFEILQKEADKGTLTIIGSQDRLSHAGYDEGDVTTVRAGQIQYGTGLAALGDSYEDYSNYFGEAVVLNKSFFNYPAVKGPAVDYMICNDENTGLEYRFLYGFGFSGHFKHIVSFDSAEKFISLSEITEALFEISDASILGIVFVGESKGFWGMNLKKIPVKKNSPENTLEIFDQKNFSNWINFPMDPAAINNLIAGCGIAVRDKNSVSTEIQGILSQGNNIHMHAGVFEKEPFNRRIENFEDELARIITGLEAIRIQHVLPKSLFSQGMIGIVELDI